MSLAVHEAGPGTSRLAERRSFGSRARRFGLAVFFASVAVNTAFGIYAVLAPDFGETQGKIVGTSLCITAAVVLALACEPAWQRKLLGPVPAAGAVLGAVGFSLAVAGIWAEPESEIWGKAMGNVLTVAVACAVASLLVLARLATKHGWIFGVTLALIGIATVMIGLLPWLGDDPAESYLRALGVVMIVLAAFVVTVPVMHWIDRSALVAAEAVIGIVRYCPYCGKQLAAALGVELRCTRCGRGFRVETVVLGHGQGTVIGS